MADKTPNKGLGAIVRDINKVGRRVAGVERPTGSQYFQVIQAVTQNQEDVAEAQGTANQAGQVAAQAVELTEALGQSSAELALRMQQAQDDLADKQTQLDAANQQLEAAFGQIDDLGTKVGQAQSAADTASSRADAALIMAGDAEEAAEAATAASAAATTAARDAATVAQSAQDAADDARAKYLAAAANVNNMLANPGAEFEFDGWDTSAKGTIVTQATRVRNGKKAWRVTTSGELRQGQFPVRQGETYRYRMWSWTTNTGTGSPNGGLRLQAYNANATAPSWFSAADSGQGVTTGWVMQEVVYTVPAGVTHLRARAAWANPAGVTVDFDDLEFANITDVITAQTAAANAQATADAAKTTADTAKSTADTAKANAAAAQSTADSASAAATKAQTTADNAASAAATAKTAADNANTAALNAAGLAADKGKVIVQVSAPTGTNADPENLWIDISGTPPKNQPNRYNTTTAKWEPVTDQRAVDAATAAANAKTSADSAAFAAATAQATADSAKTAASTAQQTADAAKANAATAQTAADKAQTTANNAASAVVTAQAKADQASQDAAAAAGIAGGKADVLYLTTAPPAAMQKSTTLWVDVSNDANGVPKNQPKRWNGTTWVAVTDVTATNAASAAANAASAAATAKTTADNAATAANTAQQAANTAQAAANAAAITANGRPQLLFGTATPSGTAPQGSTWFQTNASGDIIGQWQQIAASNTGSTWVARLMSSEVIANLTVGKLTAGTTAIIDAVVQKIAAQTANIQTANISNLFVTNGATMSSAVIEALFVQVVKAHKITADMIDVVTLNGISLSSVTLTGGLIRTAVSGARVEIRNDETGRGHVYFYDDNDNVAGDLRGIAAGSVPPSGASARQKGISFNSGGVFIGDTTITNPGTGPSTVKLQTDAALIGSLYANEVRDPKNGRVIVGQTTGVMYDVLHASTTDPRTGGLGYSACSYTVSGATCLVRYVIYFQNSSSSTASPGSGDWRLDLPFPVVFPAGGINYQPIANGRYVRNGSSAAGFSIYGETDSNADHPNKVWYLRNDAGTAITGAIANIGLHNDRLLMIGHYQIA